MGRPAPNRRIERHIAVENRKTVRIRKMNRAALVVRVVPNEHASRDGPDRIGIEEQSAAAARTVVHEIAVRNIRMVMNIVTDTAAFANRTVVDKVAITYLGYAVRIQEDRPAVEIGDVGSEYTLVQCCSA